MCQGPSVRNVCSLANSGYPTTRSMRVPDEQPTITLEARRDRVSNAAKLRIHLRVVAREIVAFGTAVEPERDHSDEGDQCKSSDLPGIRHGGVLRLARLQSASMPKHLARRQRRHVCSASQQIPEAAKLESFQSP